MPDQSEHQPADLKSTTTVNPGTPAWLVTDPCPSWCNGDHRSDDHPEDRAHVAAAHVPVVRPCQPPAVGGEAVAEAAEYIVVMRRYVGQTDTWIYIGEGEDTSRAVEVTAESARRLATEAAKLIGQAFA